MRALLFFYIFRPNSAKVFRLYRYFLFFTQESKAFREKRRGSFEMTHTQRRYLFRELVSAKAAKDNS